MASTIDSLFAKAAKAGASDVHVASGSPVFFRIDGVLEPQGKQVMSSGAVESMVRSLLGSTEEKRFKELRELDISYEIGGGVRLRVNCHYERGTPGFVARIIPAEIPTLENLNLKHLEYLCDLEDGLILFTGPTGTGKSTSLAAMVQHIADTHGGHIVTLEDPIEFVFAPSENGLIRQREFGEDFVSFAEGLKRVLRQDPDIVMVGEMRDLETIAATLTLAETGHLVFATLHTPDAAQTIERIVDVFPPYQQQQIRVQLSLSLKAVIAQRLLPKEGGGRVAQREVLINTPAVSNIIRDNRVHELLSVLQTSAKIGMTTFAADAKRLYKEGAIGKETYAWAGR